MTSSKSFRAAFIPSSFSLSALRPNSEPDDSSRKTSQRKASLELPHEHRQRQQQQQHQHGSPHQQILPRRQTTHMLQDAQRDSVQPLEVEDGEPVPSSFLGARSKTWSDRLTSFLPTLMSPTADEQLKQPQQPQHRPSIQRKPIASSQMPPHDTPPPPPYDFHQPPQPDSSQIGLAVAFENAPPQPRAPPPSIPEPNSSNAPFLPFDIPGFSISGDENPHIMAPTPPSPEAKRATLTKQQPAARPGAQRSNVPEHGGDLPRTRHAQNENDEPRRRRASAHRQSPDHFPQPALRARQSSPAFEPRGRRSVSAQVLSSSREDSSGSRAASAVRSRPVSVAKESSQSPTRGRVRRSWMPGGNRSRSNSVDMQSQGMQAWVISDDTQAEYNPLFLKNAEKVPELWNDNGSVLVYLYPRGSGCGPSFKVPEFTVSSSPVFNELIRSDQESPVSARSRARSFGGRDSLSVTDATRLVSPPMSSPTAEFSGDARLYFPTAPPTATGQLSAPGEGSHAELDRLIGIRNLFAFLTGQPLVGTKSRPTVFLAFLQIASLLQEFAFSSADGTSFGNAVDLSFGFYSDQHGFSDCRHSREKTLEALILAERMRSADLYNEAFAHAAGKYSAIMDLRLPLFEQISADTRQRLERAYLDLINRQHNVNEHLEQFEFPSLFAGIASSTSVSELKQIRFKVWKNSFSKMRQFIMSHYKTTFGNWPPKARSKKNPFAESGLNRLVLKVLYSDMCALYDLLVDRTKLTSRATDSVPIEIVASATSLDKMIEAALRNILSEYDRSKPPMLPPIPFDLPQMPSMTAIHENFETLPIKEQFKMEKKLKDNEMRLVLNKAYNFDTNSIQLPFLEQFKEFEAREGKGKPTPDLLDQRIGYWLFIYVVLQSLPMLVVDAPGLKFSEGTEYFLCEPPIGNPPWVEDRQVRKMWYEVADGGGLVELSADAVMFSVEATYHRSHCWLAAKGWESEDGANVPPPAELAMSPLQPPPGFQGADGVLTSPPAILGPGTPSPPPGPPQPALRPRNLSPAGNRSSSWRSSIVMGIEPVPMDAPTPFTHHQRSSSMGPQPPSMNSGNRSMSVGNLAGFSQEQPGTGRIHRPPGQSGSSARDSVASSSTQKSTSHATTFDAILGESQSKSAGKKKSRFF